MYKFNENPKQDWSTSTIVFMGIIILALSVSLFLCLTANLRDSHVIACKDYEYNIHNQKVCLVPEEELVK